MKKQKFKYNPKLKEYARKLRNNPTNAEKVLWFSLKGKQIKGYDFDRQKPIGNFIFDFYCSELNLVIEIDGISHEDEKVKENDELKTAYIKSLGLDILRFTDDEVLGAGNSVIEKIEEYIKEHEKQPHTPRPPLERG